ncbi:Choline transporter-like protein [Plasmodiophora brassicae]|uniref:Choline transporter-like protein n=1 Tax=Plasmodiophora brassicae TaxID=37360 RepID=A0A0G4IUL1_PLABS|nr:hypothetical protein PBRA_007074 [Plasmodiophora brassicae]SPQ95733.1 unnamed protein product [Plasmodiophora brassicae]
MGNCLGCSCEEKGDTPLFEIKKKRGCTDVPFLLLFIAFWAVVVIMLQSASSMGADPKRLIRGVDWNGNICGVSPGYTDTPLAAWPMIPVSPDLEKVKVCVADCSQTQTDAVFRGPVYQKLHGYSSQKFLYYCMPELTGNLSALTLAGFGTEAQSATAAIGDLLTTANVIGISAGVAVLLSFFYLWFCKRMAGVLIWSSILVVLVGGFLIGYGFLLQAKQANASPDASSDPQKAQVLQYISYAVFAVTLLYLIVIIALRKRIKIAVEVVKEASKAVGDMPMMISVPFTPFVFSLGYIAFWIYGALMIFSVVTVTPVDWSTVDPSGTMQTLPGAPSQFQQRSWNQSMQNFFAAHFFHLLWNVQFFIYFGYMVIAGCVANWYFTPYKDNGKKPRGSGEGELPKAAVSKSFGRAVRYHLGTIAFGSLLIAIVEFIRAVITYIEKKSKKMKDNPIRKAIFCCIQCCLKLVQCCLDKLSKNAFIYCAIYGDPFCVSAWTSFAILWRNLARVAAINMVGTYISVLGKLLVAFGTAGIAVQIMTNFDPWKSTVSSPYLTVFVVMLLGYVVAAIFMVVYETAIDTIFLCFLLDEEQNKHGQMLASKGLLEIINRYTTKPEEKHPETAK